MLTNERRNPALFGKATVIIHRREGFKTVGTAGNIVVGSVARSDVNLPGSLLHGHEFRAYQAGRPVQEGVPCGHSNKLLTQKVTDG